MGSYKQKLGLLVTDIVIIWISIYFAYWLRFYGHIPTVYMGQATQFAVVSTCLCVVLFFYYKLYSRLWRYASVAETLAILKSVIIACVASYFLMRFAFGEGVMTFVLVMTIQTMTLGIGGVRFIWKFTAHGHKDKSAASSKAMIIGAGDCGSVIARELKMNPAAKMDPVAFIDDNNMKQHYQIMGIPVVGSRKDIVSMVKKLGIEHIIIAMPSVSKGDIKQIIDICKQTKAKLKIVPIINDLIIGKVNIQHIRDVQVEDLLGRDPVNTDLEGIANYVEGKTVLVTGAGGSIGSELCRQISMFNPSQLLLLGHGENSIYTIEMELRQMYPQLKIDPIIADVQDRSRIEQVFIEHMPQVVFHAAAHKHVPLMERNPAEAIKNNVFGTRNVAWAADLYGAERFVLISTDKAVNPTSVMGTTKRIAEMIIHTINRNSKTKFAAVRFGNVLGSRGSVIPRFKEQIRRGGPVTVTHPEMVRFFMTIPEAVQLVIQAGSYAKGGEVFVLDMGEPVKISDLAKGLIKLSGLEPDVDIKIVYSGMRPGEKLYEELLTSEEGLTSTTHNRIFVGKSEEHELEELRHQIRYLERVVEEPTKVRQALKDLVPTYKMPALTVEPIIAKELEDPVRSKRPEMVGAGV